MLHAGGYKARALMHEIERLLNEANPLKALPRKLRETVDSICNFGNFAAHPADNKATLELIDVEPDEAEWRLEMIEDLFEHYHLWRDGRSRPCWWLRRGVT